MKYIKLYENYDKKKVKLKEGDKWFPDSRGDYLINTSTELDSYLERLFKNLSIIYDVSKDIEVYFNYDDPQGDTDFYHKIVFNVGDITVIYYDYVSIDIDDHGYLDDEDGVDYNEYNMAEIDVKKNRTIIHSDTVSSILGYSEITDKKITPVIDKIISHKASDKLVEIIANNIELYDKHFDGLSNKSKNAISNLQDKNKKLDFF